MARHMTFRRQALPLAVVALMGLGACTDREVATMEAVDAEPEVARVLVPVVPEQAGQATPIANQTAGETVMIDPPATDQSYTFQTSPANPPDAAVEAVDTAGVPETWQTGQTAAGDQGTMGAMDAGALDTPMAATGDTNIGMPLGMDTQPAGTGEMTMAQGATGMDQPGATMTDAQADTGYAAEPDTATMGAGAEATQDWTAQADRN